MLQAQIRRLIEEHKRENIRTELGCVLLNETSCGGGCVGKVYKILETPMNQNENGDGNEEQRIN